MSITSIADLRDQYDSARRITAYKSSVFNLGGGTVNRYYGHIWDLFEQSPNAGAPPTTINGTQYSKSSVGAISLATNTVSGALYGLADIQVSANWTPANESTPAYVFPGGTEYYVHIWDRIWANAVNQKTTARQSIVFPALARYAGGQQLSIWLKWLYTFTTPTANITIEYTNQSGVARTCTFSNDPNINNLYHEMSICAVPLIAGDSGVQSINAITLSAAAADGPSNALSVMLAKYLGCYRVSAAPTSSASSSSASIFSGIPFFDGNACLTLGVQTAPSAVLRAGIGPTTVMPQIGLEGKLIAL